MRRFVFVLALLAACSDGDVGGDGDDPPRVDGGTVPPPLTPSCEPAASGSASVGTLTALPSLADEGNESWLGSPAVADLDGNGDNEVIVGRDEGLVVWHADGTLAWRFRTEGRIWASPVVADFRDGPELEVAIAARGRLHLLDFEGNQLSGFPVTWEDELRSLAAGDLDDDGQLDIVAATTDGGPGDVVTAWRASGELLPGFPPLQFGNSGCEEEGECVLAGAYDQNLAVGDLDGEGGMDLVIPHDNAYASFHHGNGAATLAAAGFASNHTPGVRYLHDLAEAQVGFAEDESTALQAHFTNTSPAIADVDGNGDYEIVMVGSVQNASQEDREKGVALWVMNPDASRLAAFVAPVHFPDFIGGFEDLGGNVVGQTQQVTVADLDPLDPGPELLFAGFDGRIHAVGADGTTLWAHDYSDRDELRTQGVAVADLSGDGVPEIVYATYSTEANLSELVVLDGGGNPVQRVDLPGRGAMSVPTIADLDGDGTLEILVSLKDADDAGGEVLVFRVPGSATNCLLWPTGRANLLRNGWIP